MRKAAHVVGSVAATLIACGEQLDAKPAAEELRVLSSGGYCVSHAPNFSAHVLAGGGLGGGHPRPAHPRRSSSARAKLPASLGNGERLSTMAVTRADGGASRQGNGTLGGRHGRAGALPVSAARWPDRQRVERGQRLPQGVKVSNGSGQGHARRGVPAY